MTTAGDLTCYINTDGAFKATNNEIPVSMNDGGIIPNDRQTNHHQI